MKSFLQSLGYFTETEIDTFIRAGKQLSVQVNELFQQIPQYHIASYLGVSPQSLSRIRAKRMNTDGK